MFSDIFILRMITETEEMPMSKKSTRLEALHNTFEENGILPENIMVNDTLLKSRYIIHRFAQNQGLLRT